MRNGVDCALGITRLARFNVDMSFWSDEARLWGKERWALVWRGQREKISRDEGRVGSGGFIFAEQIPSPRSKVRWRVLVD